MSKDIVASLPRIIISGRRKANFGILFLREDIIILPEMEECFLGSGFWIEESGTSWEKMAVYWQINGFLREESGIFSIRMEAIIQTAVHKDIKSDTILLKRNKKLIFYFINDFALFWRKYGFDRYYRVFGF